MSHDPVCYTCMLYGHRNVLSCCDIHTHYVMYPLQTSIAIRRALVTYTPTVFEHASSLAAQSLCLGCTMMTVPNQTSTARRRAWLRVQT
jgi:hypothetical protein